MSKETFEEFVKLSEELTPLVLEHKREKRVCPCCGKKLKFGNVSTESLARAKRGFCLKCFRNEAKWKKEHS